MGRVLVTGHRGMVGRAVVPALEEAGFEVVGLDLADGADLADPIAVRARMVGCRFVVHLAALDEAPDERSAIDPRSTGDVSSIIRTNVVGTAGLLAEARAAGVERIAFLSSVDVLGCFMGQGQPAYLPIDDAHPVAPRGSYAWSKLACEELLASYSAATGGATVCLRAPGVFDEATYEFIRSARSRNPSSEWLPFWEYGAFVDVRDVASAAVAVLTVPDLVGHHRVFVNADDISSSSEDGVGLAGRLLPDVPFRRSDRFIGDRWAALVDNVGARKLLDWTPRFRWRP